MLVSAQNYLYSFRKITDLLKDQKQQTRSTMGILIDATAPIYRQRDKDYITQLKLIDDTLNQLQPFGVMIKYMSVFVFSPKAQLIEFCDRIGQVILLDKFIFKVWHKIRFQTKYLSRTQYLCCFEVDSESNLVTKGFLRNSSIGKQTTESIYVRVLQLHQWFQAYFINDYKPMLGVSLVNNYTIMAEPFNLILRSLQGEKEISQKARQMKQENDKTSIYLFEDGNGNNYFMKQNTLKKNLPKYKYILMRGVNCIHHFYEIKLVQTGNYLGLPPQYQSFYQEIMNYCAVSRFNERFLLRNHKICQLSRVTYMATETTPVIELSKMLDLYENRISSRGQQRAQDLYMIEVAVINFHGNLHMFHVDHQMIVQQTYISSLTQDQRKQLVEENKLSYLYQGTLGVIDRSYQKEGKLFNVHLFSNQPRTRFYESDMINGLIENASRDFTKALQKEVKGKIQYKLRELIEKSTFSNSVSMIVEPIRGDTMVFRLTNTIFE